MITMLVLALAAGAIAPTDGETTTARDWASAHFDAAEGVPFFSFVYGGELSERLLKKVATERSSRRIDDTRIEYTLRATDPKTGLEVRCIGIAYQDFPTVEWTLYFKNNGTTDSPILEQIQALDASVVVPKDGELLLHRNTGDICAPDSYAPHADPLPPNTLRTITNTGGRPTQSEFPYFNLEWKGGGLIAVVSWAGQWCASVGRGKGTDLRLRAGQGLTHFTLHPGEEVRTPMIVLQFYEGDWLRAQNLWRRWMIAHNTPRPGGKPVKPMMSLCTGNYYPNLMTVADKERSFLERHIAEKIDFDCWWQDAGWYPCDGVGWPKTGTWEVDPVRFPKGLRELSDYMHANGKVTMVWFEPERVHPGTWITEQHPEWVYGGANGGLLKLGDPACRTWLTDHIDHVLTAQGIDYYRQDFNIDPLPYWRGADAEDRQGIEEIRHVEGYFAYWDELRKRHPNMLIDSCASGGRRNDLETLRRAVPLLRSDWYNGPEGQQCLSYGLSLWIPYHGTGVIYEKDEYWTRSSMMAELSFGPDAADVTHFDFARWRRLTGEWRRIADNFLGDFHPLTPYTLATDAWMVWQFDRPDLGQGVVQAFRRPDCPYTSVRVCLKELAPAASYAITDFDASEPKTYTGKELLETGLSIDIQEHPKARILAYKKLP